MLLRKIINLSPFLQDYRLKYSFTLNLKQFQVFRIAKFEFKVMYTLVYKKKKKKKKKTPKWDALISRN